MSIEEFFLFFSEPMQTKNDLKTRLHVLLLIDNVLERV